MSRIPEFHFAIPFLPEDATRVDRTAESLWGQSAVSSGRATLKLSLVSSSRGFSMLTAPNPGPLCRVEQYVERGSGMYSALADVLEGSDADFFGYLGAGDTLEPQAFDLVLENAPADSGTTPWWCTGYISTRREDGAIVRVTLPYRYRSRFFETGLHGSILPTIQQESTLWNAPLNRDLDFDRLRSLRLAGDYYLWLQFCRYVEPLVIEAVIGSFRWHGDNISADWEAYQAEVAGMTRRPHLGDKLLAYRDLGMWALPARLRLKLASGHLRRFRWPEGPWSDG